MLVSRWSSGGDERTTELVRSDTVTCGIFLGPINTLINHEAWRLPKTRWPMSTAAAPRYVTHTDQCWPWGFPQLAPRLTRRALSGLPFYQRPIRGMSAVVAGAGPAHACFFATYEQSKHTLGQLTRHRHDHITHGLSGCLASLVHDAVSNPAEVVKQRLQMLHSPYRGAWECARRVYRAEGLRAFYRSYGTQVTMNVPFQAVHFVTYEWCQARLNSARAYDPVAHACSGALAGALAAAATTPLDVCKTALNTQEATAEGLAQAAALVLRTSGPRGFLKGVHARVLYQMPAAAICWLTYETFKHALAETGGGGEDGPAKDRSNTNVSNVSGVGGVGSVGPPLACAALRLAAEVPPPTLTRT